MATRLRSTVLIAIAVLAAVLLTSLVGVSRVLAETTTLDGLTATARVEASPYSFWFGQVNRDGICRLISGCVSATGADPNWVFKVDVPLVGSGTQTLDVNVQAADQVTGEKARYTLGFDSPLGTLHGNVDLVLKPSGDATIVSLQLNDMVATGFAQESIPQFQQSLQPYLASQMSILGRQRDDAGTKVTLAVKPGSKAQAKVVVSGASLTKKAPKARGKLRVLVGNKVVCTAEVRNSKGACRFTAPKKGAEIRAVVTGTLSNGYPVWNSATKRYRP
jgi:carbon monoxide dehydrogenase subunit G